jgi:2'-5' RNA ligase
VSETVVVVPVLDAEPLVGAFRRLHTEDGAEGMPAHVTLLAPFVDGGRLDVGALRGEIAWFRPFELALHRLARFDGTPAVLYAVPDPAAPFVAMTEALSARFGVLPYEGAHDEIVPHLTIAISPDAVVLERIEAALAPSLPIATAVACADVWTHGPGRWTLTHRLPLG